MSRIQESVLHMARMKRGARTQAVREYLAENPDASPKSVVEGLQQKGIKVKITLVNSIKYKKPAKGAKRKSTAGRAGARSLAGGAIGFEQLVEVKKLVDALGGSAQVQQALDAIKR